MSRALCAALSKDKSTPWDIQNMYDLLLGKKIVAIVAYAPFTLAPGSIKWISVLPSLETPTCVIYKFSTFVFNKVVQ